MSRSRLLLLLLLPLLLLTMAFRQTPLIDLPPIAVPDGVTAVQAGKAAKAALVGRGWTITAEQDDGIDATLVGHDYTARIHVSFNDKQLRFVYVDSTNLKYEVKKDGQRLIHTNYMSWMHYLVDDTSRNLIMLSAGAKG